MAGDINVPWSPYIGLEDVGKRYKISKWKRDFILKKGPDSWGEAKTFSFKIGQFPIDCTRFLNDKKGWPFIWCTWRGLKQWHCKLQFEIEVMMTFTDQAPHGMTEREIRDLASDIRLLKSTMYAIGDATMNT